MSRKNRERRKRNTLPPKTREQKLREQAIMDSILKAMDKVMGKDKL